MQTLLDECLPWRLRRELAEHDVRSVQFMGWAGLKNGELLAKMRDAQFEAFITIDQNVPFQQNLQQAQIAVIVIRAKSNRGPDVLPLARQIRTALDRIKPGELIRIGG